MKKPFVLLLVLLALTGCSSYFERTPIRDSAAMAPSPATTREAVLQVYGADVWGWAGLFAIHTWIATKGTNDDSYTVYEVVSEKQRRGPSRVRIERDLPDRYWYGARPRLLKEFRGNGVDKLINSVEKAARSYPWPGLYKAFPGPNSNTFTAWIAKQVPELSLSLPFSAIGSDFVERWTYDYGIKNIKNDVPNRASP
jgi:uncharacterized protein YceK